MKKLDSIAYSIAYSIAIVAGLSIASLTPLVLLLGAVANSVEEQPLQSQPQGKPQGNALGEKREKQADRPLHPKYQGDLLFKEGEARLQEGELAAALEKLEAALILYRSTESRFSEGKCLGLIGVINTALTDYQGAILAYEQSLEIFRETDQSFYEILIRQNVGSIYFDLAEYEKALESYHQTLELVENIGEENIVASPLFLLAKTILQDSIEEFRYRSITTRTLSLIGRVHYARGEYDRAFEFADRALEMAKSTGDRPGEGIAIHRIGQIYHDRGQYPQARDYYQQSLQIKEEVGDRRGVAITFNSLALIHDELGEYEEALNLLEQALEIEREVNKTSRVSEATILNNIGKVYDSQEQYDRALEYYQQALDIQEQNSDRSGIATTVSNIGVVYVKRGQYPQAEENFQKAIAIYEEIGDPVGTAITLNNLASVSKTQGEYQQALDFYQQALTISEKIGTPATTETVLNNIGEIYADIGQYTEALTTWEQAWQIATALGKQVSQGTIINNISVVRNYLGQYQIARADLETALAIFQKIGDRRGISATLSNIALVAFNQGKYRESLAFYQQALMISRDLGDPKTEALALNSIGNIHESLGQYDLAEESMLKALEISRQLGYKQLSGTTLNNLGVLLRNAGRAEETVENHEKAAERYQQAIETLEMAATVLKSIGTERELAGVLMNIGEIYRLQQKYDRALEYHQQALQLQQKIGFSIGEAASINNIGLVYFSLEKYDQAKDYFDRALTIYQKVGEPQGKARVLANIAIFYEQQGNIPEAIARYQQSIDAFESIRGELKISELVASFADRLTKVYERQIDLLWQSGRFEEAFHAVERSRGQAFLNQFAQGSIDFRFQTAANLLEKEQILRAEITALRTKRMELLNRRRSELDPEALASVNKQIEQLEKDYEQLLVELKVQNPEYADLITGEVASLETIQKQLTADRILLEYFVTEERTLAFIIGQNSFKTVSLDIDRQELTEEIENFRNFSNTTKSHPDGLKNLHQWLISPLKPYLTTSKIAVVPHSVLHYLPFAALTDGEKYLIEDYVLSTLPSASILPYLEEKRKPNAGYLFAIGNPQLDKRLCKGERLCPLESAELEVQAIAKMYGTEALIGAEATESAVKSQAANAEIIHFAAHGKYNQNNPLFSTLYLTEDSQNDGRMEVHEIYDLDLSSATNLVVMSACETQIGNLSASDRSLVSPGDEIVALNRAFLYAGTPNVMGTLWSINDKTSGFLMQQFYTHLQNMNSGEALRQAQIDFRAEYPEYSHPYYWAAFVLTGEGL